MARGEKKAEKRRALRAVLLLAVFVVAGVFAAEAQMNALTLRSDFVRAANLRREAQGYALYALGERVALTDAGYPAAVWEGGALIVRLGRTQSLVLPVADAEREALRLAEASRRGLGQAYDDAAEQLQAARRSAASYAKELQEYLETF